MTLIAKEALKVKVEEPAAEGQTRQDEQERNETKRAGLHGAKLPAAKLPCSLVSLLPFCEADSRLSLDVLACPQCLEHLRLPAPCGRLNCPRCLSDFPVVEGIPMLLKPFPGPRSPEVDLWDTLWKEYKQGPERPTERLVQTLGGLDLAGKVVCEIGCGTGKDSLHLLRAGAKVICLDYSSRALALVRARAQSEGCECPVLVGGDTLHLPLSSESIDLIFHQGLLEHFHDPASVLAEQTRTLKPGAFLLVDVPQRFNLYALWKRWQMFRGTWFAGWETDFSYRGLWALLKEAGLTPLQGYAYGFFPPLFWLLRHLHEVGGSRFGRPLMPEPWREPYERFWEWWERGALGKLTLACVGVLAQKPES